MTPGEREIAVALGCLIDGNVIDLIDCELDCDVVGEDGTQIQLTTKDGRGGLVGTYEITARRIS